MYKTLEEINKRPKPFEFYTAESLWTDPHTSKQMLLYHLNGDVDLASRNSSFIKKSTDWIISEFSLSPGKSICDFGCGPGLYTSLFAETGAIVTGVDFSHHSLEYARNHARENRLDINYIQANYLDHETSDQYDVITMIMCDFCALSPEQRKSLLKRMREFLKDDGSLLLDVYTIKGYDEREETSIYEKNQLNGFWSAEDYYGFLTTFKYDEEKVILDKYTIIEKTGSKVIYNWLSYFSEEDLKNEFNKAGFSIKTFYDDAAGTAYSGKHSECAVVAVKA